MITLLVMTDGRRQCIARTIASAREKLVGEISRCVIHDDSGDEQYAQWLRSEYGDCGYEIVSTGRRSGFDGAMRSAWAWLCENDDRPWVFHLEDDFVFPDRIMLSEMLACHDSVPGCVQVSLMRQPWNRDEKKAGGVVALNEQAFMRGLRPVRHLRQRLYFTTNPSVYRRELILQYPWPTGASSEGRFSYDLFDDPQAVAVVLGHGEPQCTHIGDERVGHGY